MSAEGDEREEPEERLDEALAAKLGVGEREEEESAREGGRASSERARGELMDEEDAAGGGERRGEAEREGRKPEGLNAQEMEPVEERRLSIIRVEEPLIDGVEEVPLAEHLAGRGAIEALIPIAEALIAEPGDKTREGREREQERVEPEEAREETRKETGAPIRGRFLIHAWRLEERRACGEFSQPKILSDDPKQSAPSRQQRRPKLLSSPVLMSQLFIRRVSLYARAALITSLAFVAANLVYGASRYHLEPTRAGVLITAAFHSLALSLLPALALAVSVAGIVSAAAPLLRGSLPGRLLRAPLFSKEPALVARGLAALFTLALFAAGAQQLGYHFATRYHNPLLASLALAASIAALGVAAQLLFGGLDRLLNSALTRFGALARPALLLSIALALFIGAAAAFLAAFPSIFYVYHPFDLLLLPASFLLFAILAFIFEKRIPEPRSGVAPLIALLSLALILISAFSYGERYRHRVWVEDRFPVVKQLYRIAATLTDRDGDGYSALFGGEDCDDRDPSIHPGAADPPGDGIDSDCFAGDGGPEVSSMSDGRYHPERLYEEPPNILFITADALRPDHLGCFGYERETSPFIDELCAKSYRFHEAVAQSSRSIRSIPSTFTGFMPSQIAYGSEYLFPELLPENVLIAEVLRPRYRTSAVVGTNYFKPFKGLEQGFLSFRQDPSYTPPRERTVDWAIEELKQLRSDRRPFFLWTYLFHTHEPYLHDDLPSMFGPAPKDAYDTEVRMLDGELRRLIEALEELDFERETIIILHSDHGEAFFEHGLIGHSHNTHREEIRSTLLIHLPGQPGGDIKIPVPLADLMPTIANLANIPLRHDIPSRSLVP